MIHISLTGALPFPSQSPPALFIFKGQQFYVILLDLITSLQTFPKIWQLLSPVLAGEPFSGSIVSVLQGHFQFCDLTPYLPSPIKIWGKITKRQVHNFRENLKPEADRGWKKQREEIAVSFLQGCNLSFKSPTVSKAPRFQSRIFQVSVLLHCLSLFVTCAVTGF